MRFDKRRGLYLPQRLTGPKAQRGSILLAAFGVPLGVQPQLDDMTAALSSTIISPTSDQPQVSVRFLATGKIQEATGDTGSALSYSDVGDWLSAIPPVDASDWELNFTIDTEDGGGETGTWTGSTRGSFLTLDSTRTFTWTKDDSTVGQTISTVTATLRRVSQPALSVSRTGLTYTAEVGV